MKRFKFSFFLLFAVMIAAPVAHAALATPPDLSPGDQFRWVFVTSGTTNATNSSIDYYNTFVNGAATGGILTSEVDGDWKVIGSTSSVDAIDNIGSSTYPVYRLDGELIKSHQDDLWAPVWTASVDLDDWPINIDENGETVDYDTVWTGTGTDGAAYFSNYLGATNNVHYGDPSTYDGPDWISSGTTARTISMPLYAISAVQTVVPIPGAVWLLGSGLIGIVGIRRKFKK